MHQPVDYERVTAPVRIIGAIGNDAACAIFVHYREWSGQHYNAGFLVDLVWTATGETIEESATFETGNMDAATLAWLALTSDPYPIWRDECRRAIGVTAELRAEAMKLEAA